MFKKTLALVLAVLMLLPILPTAVFAEDDDILELVDNRGVAWARIGDVWYFTDKDGEFQVGRKSYYKSEYGVDPSYAIEEDRYYIFQTSAWVEYVATQVLVDENDIVWYYNAANGWRYVYETAAGVEMISISASMVTYSTYTGKTKPSTAYDAEDRQYVYENGDWKYFPESLNGGINPTDYNIKDENGVTWFYVSTGTDKGWKFQRGMQRYSYSSYPTVVGKTLPRTGTYKVDDSYTINFTFAAGVWYYGFSSGLEGESGSLGSSMAYIMDENGIEWGYYSNAGWVFFYEADGEMHPAAASAYKAKTGFNLPENGWLDGLITKPYHFNGTSWVSANGESIPGLNYGDYTLLDDNGIYWVIEDGMWCFYREIESTYPYDFYSIVIRKDIPKKAYMVSNGMTHTFKWDAEENEWTYDSSESNIQAPDSSDALDLIEYLILDENDITWKYDAENGWQFYLIVNSSIIWNSYGAYKRVTGFELPELGETINKKDGNIDCEFSNGYWFPKGSSTTPSTPGTTQVTLVDNNGIAWRYFTNDGWLFYYEGDYYASTRYTTVTKKSAPFMGEVTYNGQKIVYFYFNNTWYTDGTVTPEPSNPSNPSTPSTPKDVTALEGCVNPNNVEAVYDEKGYIWTKDDPFGNGLNVSWESTNSAKYTFIGKDYPKYIDSQNRYWELRTVDGWVLNPYATPSTPVVETDPNKMANLEDTKGYTWTKYGTTWYCAKMTEYSKNNETPMYEAADDTIWYFVSNEWTKTKPVDTSPNSKLQLTDNKGYHWYLFNGTWMMVEESDWYTKNNLVPLYTDANKKLWKLVNNRWVEADGTEPTEPAKPATPVVSDIFTDISKNLWCAEYIQYVYDNKLYNGVVAPEFASDKVTVTKPGEFNPDGKMSRAMFVLVLARLAKVDLSTYTTVAFDDIGTLSQEFQSAIAWAAGNGIVNGRGWIEGVGNNCFDPNSSVSRQDACTILIRFAEEYEKRTLGLNYTGTTYTDRDSIADYAKAAVSYCQQLGFLSGNIVDNNKFHPADPATRAEVATIIARYAEKYSK